MARPPASPQVSRVFSTIISGAVWWLILYGPGYLFSGGSHVTHASPLTMANVTAISFLFIPYFASHGTLISLLNGVLKGTISAPPASAAAPGIPNPWRIAVNNGLIFGLVPAAIGYFIASGATPDTLTPGAFAVRFASAGALLAVITVWFVAGEPFLRACRAPHEKRAFEGTPKQYLWRHFIWPHAIANAIINGVLAYALSPGPVTPDAIVPTVTVIGDLVVTSLILTFLIASGARSQARVETLWGVAPPALASKSSVPVAFMTPFFASIGFAIAVGVIMWLMHVPGMSVGTWALFRGVVFGVYPGWLCALVAPAVVNATLNEQSSAAPATSAAA